MAQVKRPVVSRHRARHAALALAAMIYTNAVLFGVFVAILVLGYVYFRLTRAARDAAPVDEMLQPGA